MQDRLAKLDREEPLGKTFQQAQRRTGYKGSTKSR